MPEKTNKLEIIKEIFDIAADLPGIAAFIKVFFGEKAAKQFEDVNAKKFAANYRPKVQAMFFSLPENRRKNLEWRVREAQSAGTEDQLTYSLGTILEEEPDVEKAKEHFMWLDSLDDDRFNAMMDILHDDKLDQFLTRASRWMGKHMAEFNDRWHVRLEALQHNVEVWERRQKAKAAETTPNPTARRVLRNPLWIIPWILGIKPKNKTTEASER